MGRWSDNKYSCPSFNMASLKLALKSVKPEKTWYLLIKICKKIVFFWSSLYQKRTLITQGRNSTSM